MMELRAARPETLRRRLYTAVEIERERERKRNGRRRETVESKDVDIAHLAPCRPARVACSQLRAACIASRRSGQPWPALPVQCLPASHERFIVRIVLADEFECFVFLIE